VSPLRLVVERAFAIHGRGVGLEPGLPLDVADQHRGRFGVLVSRPDGSELIAEAVVEVAHTWQPTYRAWAVMLLVGLRTEDVPKGSVVVEN
jgi:hypothetical protein